MSIKRIINELIKDIKLVRLLISSGNLFHVTGVGDLCA